MAMRSIIIALFLALAAFAQEMDTTFVVNEQGQTVGIIHEKGTVPVIPKAAPAYAYSAQQDSLDAYYLKKTERSTHIGRRYKGMSTAFFIAGGIGLAVNIPIFVYSAHRDYEYTKEQKRKNPDYEPPTDADPVPIFSFIGAGVGVGFLVAGTIFYFTGSKKLRNAEFFKKKISTYQNNGESVSLEILPTFNPIHQAFGGNLLLEF